MKLLEGKSVSIIGLGASGMAAARLALVHGGDVYVSDSKIEPAAAAGAAELRSLGARVELGGHDVGRMARTDTVVVSPGIPPDASVLEGLRARGSGWISEPEFAFRFLKGPLIAVTGTNGKTTTAAMTAQLLEQGGLSTGLGGNIGADFGPPASGLALADPAPDWFVVEVSSFQLADVVDFSPSIGVVTNLAPDHLDRYETLNDYYSDKGRLFQNASDESTWVLNGDLPEVEELAGDASGRRFRFSSRGAADSEAYLQDGMMFLGLPGEEARSLLDVAELGVLGRHNASNALAAALTARLAGVSTSAIAAGLKGFKPLPHRMEVVGDREGRRWVNDSKATNVAATSGALQSLEGPLVLLLGGTDKEEDLEPLREAIHPGVRCLVLFGEARHRMAATLDGAAPMEVVDGPFEEAVNTALHVSVAGDILLLSPACSSFDMFRNYVERGLRFSAFARGDA